MEVRPHVVEHGEHTRSEVDVHAADINEPLGQLVEHGIHDVLPEFD